MASVARENDVKSAEMNREDVNKILSFITEAQEKVRILYAVHDRLAVANFANLIKLAAKRTQDLFFTKIQLLVKSSDMIYSQEENDLISEYSKEVTTNCMLLFKSINVLATSNSKNKAKINKLMLKKLAEFIGFIGQKEKVALFFIQNQELSLDELSIGE